jgi:hypothetical protein
MVEISELLCDRGSQEKTTCCILGSKSVVEIAQSFWSSGDEEPLRAVCG